jgi:hypothetical protein
MVEFAHTSNLCPPNGHLMLSIWSENRPLLQAPSPRGFFSVAPRIYQAEQAHREVVDQSVTFYINSVRLPVTKPSALYEAQAQAINSASVREDDDQFGPLQQANCTHGSSKARPRDLPSTEQIPCFHITIPRHFHRSDI